jgi:L-arabinose isomerase
MWINGLKILNKPLLHLHTQYNRDLPWSKIDMDFMNLNQSAHGDREHGFIMTRLRLNRKVVVGHWQDTEVQLKIGIWTRAAAAWYDMQHMKIARFGDNMREVAVTEGDKVEAQIKLGLAVNGYGVGDIVKVINDVSEARITRLVNEDLHGLKQLPGLAVQRLMNDGFGFGAEGDWKHAAMVRVLKIMGTGLKGGCSFMEDYTYHLNPKGMKSLGAHMLEICPSLGIGKSKLEVHPLGIGGKADPARLVFDVPDGPAVAVSLIDMGNRFRLILNAVDCVKPDADLPKLPVARAVWIPQPNLKVAACAWIYAGGAHHTAFSQALTPEYIEDFAEMAGIEYVLIDKNTDLTSFKKELKWNEIYYMLAKGL